MLNMPFLATDASTTDKSAPQKSQPPKASDRQSPRSDFKEVFEDRGRDDGAQPVEPVAKRETQAPAGADGPDVEKSGKAPVETAVDSEVSIKEKTAEPVKGPAEKSVAEPVRTPVEEASAFAKTIRDLEKAGAEPELQSKPAKIATPVIATPVDVKPQSAATPAHSDVDKPTPVDTAPKVDVADDLDPMRVQVQVRSTTSSGGAAAQANLMLPTQKVPDSVAAKTTDTDVKIKKGDDAPSTRTRASEMVATAPTTTLQWRAQPSANAPQTHFQDASNATVQIDAAEGEQAPTTEALIAAREEGGARLIASGLDMAQQARFSQTTHNPAQVVRQVAEAVKTSDKGIIELTMDPPELGRLRLAMTEVSGVMNITISAENPATTDLMRRHIELLRKDFLEMGYDDVSFTFEQGDTSGQQSSENPKWPGDADGDKVPHSADTAHSQPANIPPTPQPSPSAGTGGLDIRL